MQKKNKERIRPGAYLGVDFVGLAEKNLFFGAVMIVKNSPSLTNRLDLWKIRPKDQILQSKSTLI